MALGQRPRRWIDRTAWAICLLMLIALMGALSPTLAAKRVDLHDADGRHIARHRCALALILTKEEIRRIVLSKLRIVYRGWHFKNGPFWHRDRRPGSGGMARSFETALLAGLLGSLSEAIEKNN